MKLYQRVRRTILRHALCPPGARLLVAVSGGSDSVALFWLLRELSDTNDFSVAGIGHFNHQLRASAARDEEFCRRLAERAGVPILVGTEDVGAQARTQRLSVEDAARRARQAFLGEAAVSLGAARVATGHTRDDQAETFLLKLTRGAGSTGLGGIYPSRGVFIRPVLDVRRSELQAFLSARGDAWMDDETNADLTNPRNRIRHVVLPQLEAAFGEPLIPAVARAALLSGEDGRWLDGLAEEAFAALARPGTDGLTLDADALRQLPAPVCRRVLLRAMRCQISKEIGLEHVESVLDILGGRCRAAEVPGGRWELCGANLVLVR